METNELYIVVSNDENLNNHINRMPLPEMIPLDQGVCPEIPSSSRLLVQPEIQNPDIGVKTENNKVQGMWTINDECSEIVKKAWLESRLHNSVGPLSSKLKEMAERLSRWNRETFSHVGKKIKNMQSDLAHLRAQTGDDFTKYFREESFLDAREGQNPSLTWRSILVGRQVLKDKVARRIGDGSTTSIANDNWISGFTLEKVKELCPNLPNHLKVIDLIGDFSSWKREEIFRLFATPLARNIMAIPLCRGIRDDLWFWPLTPNGCYSVKTGYREVRQDTIESMEDLDLLTQYTDVWRKIWKAQVP
ncbi:reverse transcriptase [Senna tora]|uniref:Reverse transcriptase n=1 Tax=Senna tora TaxID=362788 RepID=A0A834U025_9FABA|nr:reverse transcriptase [Senna tora]